jgi:ABC-2 type transport system ATP-binding protein
MSDDTAIKVTNLEKSFRLPHEKHTSLKSAIINFYKRDKGYEKQEALSDISFDIKKGEFFGIVGKNGSGKSTLLKLLASIYSPDVGAVQVNGKLTPFIELGVGFSPELSGRENVFLNGALLGFSRKEMNDMYDDIVSFSELRRFMDQKLKNYSSGMQVRLAFSIAIHARSDILLVDEVLAVGDVNFQQKCYDYFYRLKREKQTIIFVSHDMESVQKFCDRALVLDGGHIKFIGKPTEAATLYKELNFPENTDNTVEGTNKSEDGQLKITLTDIHNKPKTTFTYGDTMIVNLDWSADPRAQFLGVAIHRDDGMYIFGPNNIGPKRAISPHQHKAEYIVQLNLGNGKYYVEVVVFGRDEGDRVYYVASGPSFVMHNPHAWQGVTELSHKWVIK